MEQARTLMAQKESIESELEAQISILKANDVNMQTPLVDREGFPRADIDVYAVRNARVRIIELRNDLTAVTDALAKSLAVVYDPSSVKQELVANTSETPLRPFARVEGVAPESPALEAVCYDNLDFLVHAFTSC